MIASGRQAVLCAAVCLAVLIAPSTVWAQQSIGDVLSFLLTNRSIATGDFAGDEQAAAATSDTITTFLLSELGTLPVSSSATGFTYRMDPALGVPTRSTESFGPFFTERALTFGAHRVAFGVTFQHAQFDQIDGRTLGDGTLVATASRLIAEPQPFDVETLTLRLRTNTATILTNVGITDRLELGGAFPMIDLTLDGQRVDTYRGQAVVQATASASSSGAGDTVLRAKYNVWRGAASGLSVAAEGRLPTGRAEDLLGSGRRTFRPRMIGSYEGERVTLHGDVGYLFGSFSQELDYSAAVTVAPTSRITVVGELVGRRLREAGQLTEIAAPHPRLAGVETIRLTAVSQATDRVVALAGLKWNLAAAWLISANLSHSLTTAGLTASWVPTVGVEYAFGG